MPKIKLSWVVVARLTSTLLTQRPPYFLPQVGENAKSIATLTAHFPSAACSRTRFWLPVYLRLDLPQHNSSTVVTVGVYLIIKFALIQSLTKICVSVPSLNLSNEGVAIHLLRLACLVRKSLSTGTSSWTKITEFKRLSLTNSKILQAKWTLPNPSLWAAPNSKVSFKKPLFLKTKFGKKIAYMQMRNF